MGLSGSFWVFTSVQSSEILRTSSSMVACLISAKGKTWSQTSRASAGRAGCTFIFP